MDNEITNENNPQPERAVTVLEISPFESDHVALQQIFSHSNWRLHVSRTCAEAIAFLKRKLIPVVLCERDLPDGSWRDIVERTAQSSNPPAVIVSSRLADDSLWNEVLNCGGYNVLSKPYREAEVFRDVSLAWLNWKSRADRVRLAQERPAERPRAAGGVA